MILYGFLSENDLIKKESFVPIGEVTRDSAKDSLFALQEQKKIIVAAVNNGNTELYLYGIESLGELESIFTDYDKIIWYTTKKY